MLVADLRDRLDGFIPELRLAELSYLRGDIPELSWGRALAAFPEVRDPDSFAQVALAAGATSRTELGRRRLRRVQRFIAAQVENARSLEPIAELTRALATEELEAAHEKVTAREALVRL